MGKEPPGSQAHPERGTGSRSPLALEPGLRCDQCGSFGAFDLGDRSLCEECYRHCGSCCLEFGADDLWSEDE